MKSIKVDINSDLGESFGAYTIGRDDDVIPLISSANIACGWHAGDSVVMAKTVKTAVKAGIEIGAHPGYPDLMGFGRRNMAVSASDVTTYIMYQIGALNAFCKAEGVKMQHVKPHGALYNAAAKDANLADAICEGVARIDDSLILMGLSGSIMESSAKKFGIRFASEVFADRAYEEDGSLVARTKPGAVITDEDEAVSRVTQRVKDGTVTAVTGKKIAISADSICVHGDNSHALEFIKKIRKALGEEKIEISPLKNF